MPTRLLTKDEVNAFLDERKLGRDFPAIVGDYVLHEGSARLSKLRLDHGESEWEKAHAGESKEIVGFIVDGDLDIDGNLLNGEQDFGPTLIVLGSLRAHNLGLGGAPVLVTKDVVVRECLHGYYNHGVLYVRGDVRARALVTSEYFGKIDGVLDAPCFGSDHLEVGRRSEAAMEMRTLLVPEAIEILEDEPEDPRIDHGALFARLEIGQPVVIGGVVTEPCAVGA